MVNTLTYTYLPDGTKLSVKKSDGASIVYRGSFVYDVSADGSALRELLLRVAKFTSLPYSIDA